MPVRASECGECVNTGLVGQGLVCKGLGRVGKGLGRVGEGLGRVGKGLEGCGRIWLLEWCVQIVDECVECFVSECAPGQMGNRFESVVDEQLGQHEHEPERVDAIRGRSHQPRVPGPVDSQI